MPAAGRGHRRAWLRRLALGGLGAFGSPIGSSVAARGLVGLLGLPAAQAAETGVAVVMAAGSGPATMALDELARIYRRQQQFLAGTRVQPVNLPAGHALRRWFSQQVLGSTPEELEGYWRALYFNGTTPPYVLGSEEAVLRFVAATPGAVGYVAPCALDRRVRVLLQLDGGPACTR